MEGYLRLESLRAERYGSPFSILLVDIQSDSARPPDKDSVNAFEKIADAVIKSVRTCDMVGMAGEMRLIAVLPETDYIGSINAARKVSRQLGTTLTYATVAHATCPLDGRDHNALMNAALERLRLRGDSFWENNNLSDKLFWEIIGFVSGRPHKGHQGASFDTGAGNELSEFFIEQINHAVLSEVALSPWKKGIVYFAAKNISGNEPLIKAVQSVGPVSTRIFLIGQSKAGMRGIKNAAVLPIDDPRLNEMCFTLYLSEDTSYALVCRENWGATFSCFHTSDPFTVEGLITKFQNEYALQEQI